MSLPALDQKCALNKKCSKPTTKQLKLIEIVDIEKTFQVYFAKMRSKLFPITIDDIFCKFN